ncbi:DUF1853 family protein [Planktosalinus lacus]|uniref:DUF1853 family protein n=1 Tax=Planktosalinus lacus TaxID=1526573 RepID=A0A8J2Y9U4_9FLAO|nr:DUF1853 family protein [Planktosalinus lacus]GGD94203.1 hypothetical protein GCM10011312_17410 [Planktosalinus lacus]
MDSNNQLAKQYRGFLDTPALFKENKNFELFSFSGKNKEYIYKLELKQIPENLVLGKRVELFFQDAIKNSKSQTILAANLQVIESKVTLGELDFLVKDTLNNRFLHVELVYKFYVYDPKIEGELQRWIGPNRRDTLLYKIQKLKNKQLPLLQNKITQDYLKDMNLPSKEFSQQVCFLGKLYVPIHLYGRYFPKINNSCIVGFWLTLDAFIDRHRDDDVYCLPKKENWLIHPEDNDAWISFADSVNNTKQSLQNKKSLLCWKKTPTNSYEQFFIVWW